MKKEEILNKINPLFLKGICHRGYHNEKDSENGLKAFKNALDANYALELDIHLTKDNELIVFHDSNTKRMTGKEGIIEELTLDQIKNDYKLKDGETIPTLKEVMDLIDEKVPMVIELKVYNKNFKELALKLKEELKRIKDKRNFILISFDPRALSPFKNEGFMRQLLVCESHKWTYIFRNRFEGIDIEHVLLKKKKYQKYCKKHFSNVWTIEDLKILEECNRYVDTITFQHLNLEDIKKYK